MPINHLNNLLNPRALVNLKVLASTYLVLYLVIANWNFFYSRSCLALLVPLFASVVISWSYIDLKAHERYCFRDCYFNRNTWVSAILSSRIALIVFFLLVSLILSITMMYNLVDLSGYLLGYLAIHAMLFLFLYRWLNRKFGGLLKEPFRPMVAREWAINISGIFLVCGYMLILFNSEPSYMAETLKETKINATSSVGSECHYIDWFMRVKTELDSIYWWITIYQTDQMDKGFMKIIVWIGFVMINAMGVLGLNRFLSEIIYLGDRFFSIKEVKHEQ